MRQSLSNLELSCASSVLLACQPTVPFLGFCSTPSCPVPAFQNGSLQSGKGRKADYERLESAVVLARVGTSPSRAKRSDSSEARLAACAARTGRRRFRKGARQMGKYGATVRCV